VLHLRKVVPFRPDDSLGVPDLRDPLDLSAKEVRLLTRFFGLDRITTVGRLSVLDILLAAGEEALAGADRSLVRYVVHAHTVQHIVPPYLRHMDTVRDKLGLGEARAFTMAHQSCVTGLYALKPVEALLRAEPPGSTALILIGEKVVSSVMQHIPNTTILGDAAAACLVSLGGPGDAMLGLAQHTLGQFHAAGDMTSEQQGRYHESYVPALASVMRDAVQDAGLTIDDVSLVLPHNVNRFSWSETARLLGISLDRIYLDNIPRMGHCFSADPFVNLATARAEGAIKPGDTVLLASAGQGGTFAAAVLRIGEGKEDG
jgi:3-oxoacyl-[acyl-carrier-protein] synthase III